MRDRKRKRIITVFIALVAMVSTYLPHLPILPAQQVFAQTPNTEVEAKPAEQPPVTGNFIDYYAEERQLKGHEGSVNSANFSSNGKLIVTAGVDKTARIWDFSGQELQVLRGHEGSVRSANFSPDGQLIVTASFDGTARVWDNSGKELVSLKGHEGKLFSGNFSADGQRIVTAGVDGVRLWDTSGKQLGEIKGHLGSVYSANFSPDGKLIVTAGADKTARIWDRSGKFLTELKGHTDTVWSANFSPDSQQVVTASEDKTARVWDLSGKELAVLSGHEDTVWSANFSPDGQKIVTASVDRIGRVWDLEGRLLAKLQQHTDGVNSGSFSFDGKWIVTAGNDGTARVWDINSKLLTELKVSDTPVEELRDRSLEGASASFSTNGKFIVTESNDTIRVWDSSGTLLFEREGGHASFSPDSTKIITLSGGTPYICDISGKLLLTIQSQNGEHNLGIKKAVFSPDSKHIATVSDDGLKLWDLRGKPIVKFKENIYFYADDIEFSPDSKFIITSNLSQNSTFLWNIASKSKIELKGHQGLIKSNNFSPDSKYIVTASRNGNAFLWDNSGKFIVELQGHQDALYSAKFSSDGKLIITTSDGTAILWDIYGKALLKIQGDKSSIVSASLSSDNKRILTTYRDGSAKIWDLSGKELVVLQGHKHGVNGIFSPDDKRIITASWDGSVKVWYLLNKHLHQLALPENISSKKAKLRYDSREQQLNRSYKNINSISFSYDEKLVATAFGDDKKYNAQIWDISGKLLFELQGHEGSVNSVNFSSDNKYIVTASSDKTARIWNTSGKQIVILTGQNQILNSAVFSPDNDYIVTSSEYIVCILDSKESIALKYKQTFEHNITNQHAKNKYAKVNKEEAVDTSLNCKATLRHQEPIINTIISPNSKFIITTSYNTTSLWDMTGNLITEFKGSHMTQASFSSDSQSIAIAHDDVADIYDVSGKLKSRFKIGSLFTTGQNKFQRISFSPDGKKILISNGGVKIFDIWGKLIIDFFQSNIGVFSGVFSPDGDKIITISNSDIMFWNVSEIDNKLTKDISKKLLKRFNIRTSISLLSNIVVSPNGNFIATIPNYLYLDSFNQPQLWNMSGQLIAELKISSSPNIINFSPDGKLIVTTSESEVKNIKIWNNSGKLLTLFKQNKNHKNFSVLKFSPDSKLVVTNSWDEIPRIWDISGNMLAKFRGNMLAKFRGNMLAKFAEFSPDGKQIITVYDGTSILWDLSGKQLARFGDNPNASPKVEADRLRDLEFYAPNCELALEPWKKALKIYREIDDHENHTLMYEKLGNAYYCLSDYSKAIQSYSQGLLIAQKFKYSERQAAILSTLGNVYNTLAEDDIALQKYDEALKILPQGNSRLKSEILRGRGNIYNLRGSFAEAVKDYQEALNIDESINNESGISESKVQLASIYLALEDINKATQYYKDNLDFNEIESLAGLGRIELLLSNVDKSITLFNKSLRAAEQLANKEGKGNAFYNLGLAYYKLGQLPEAEQNLRNAIEVWENLRLNLEDTNKISIFEKQTRSYRLLQQILIDQNQREKALEVSESGRARAFIELLSQRLSPNPKEQSKPILPPDINQIKQIAKSQKATIVQYSIIYDESPNESKAQKQESKLYIWVVKPNDEKIEFIPVDLKQYLQADDINLEELVNNSRESFGVYRNASRTTTPVTNTPGKRDQFLITINHDLETENLTEYLKKLHKILIDPIAQFLPKDETQRVIFVPQGELFLVPFPALIDETGKYLIEKHTILTAPSIQVLELTRKAKENKKQINLGKPLVVGNPTMPNASLKSLEGAEAEAKAISSPKLLDTKPLIGKAATETEVVAKMPQAKIIHLATHGLFDDLRGLGSAIALAPSGKDDGFLTAEEILNFKQKLNADLVVLSACDTGRGRITGDGVIGLSRAFISSEVPSVVVSLWAVPDGETAFLMEKFYENWLQNIDKPDKATALRNAMLTTKQQHPNPRQWAAFTLIGEAE